MQIEAHSLNKTLKALITVAQCHQSSFVAQIKAIANRQFPLIPRAHKPIEIQ